MNFWIRSECDIASGPILSKVKVNRNSSCNLSKFTFVAEDAISILRPIHSPFFQLFHQIKTIQIKLLGPKIYGEILDDLPGAKSTSQSLTFFFLDFPIDFGNNQIMESLGKNHPTFHPLSINHRVVEVENYQNPLSVTLLSVFPTLFFLKIIKLMPQSQWRPYAQRDDESARQPRPGTVERGLKESPRTTVHTA